MPILMTNNKFLLLSITFFILFQSCYPIKSIIHVVPNHSEIEWDGGKANTTFIRNDIITTIGFEDSNSKYLIFHVEITNESDEKISILPHKVYLSDTFGLMRTLAIDPEKKISYLDQKELRKKKQAKNDAILKGGLILTSLALSIATKEKLKCLETNEWNNKRSSQTKSKIINSSFFWKNVTIRKTDLKPNNQIQGKIIFPRKDELHFFKVNIPIEENLFEIEFEQKVSNN